MGKLVILDYVVPSVHIYDIDSDIEVDEDFIEDLGFNVNSCYWMASDELDIYFNKKIVKHEENQ